MGAVCLVQLRLLAGWGSQQLPTVALASVGRRLLIPQAHTELVSDAGIPSRGLAIRSSNSPAQGPVSNRDRTGGLKVGYSGLACIKPPNPQPGPLSFLLHPVCLELFQALELQ